MSRMNKLAIAIALGFFGFIIWIIFRTDTNQPTVFHRIALALPYGDKIGHFCIFFILTLSANLAFQLKRIRVFGAHLFFGAVLILLFGLAEELSQLYFPKRTFDLKDITADLLGIFTASFATKWLAKKFKIS
ncbi:MAG TPA: VanZ family protein [Methylotenera sp.]|nr:VanZ family protein [Methylotenera sp.]HPH05301.1 VanZ family protein [Methylotenera sp.]HPN00203.1 VanZ family protein [Methylotenera sp.]